MEANHRMVSIGNYSLSSLTIGEGSFSKVKVAKHKVLDKNVAMKLITKSSIKDPYVLRNLERESKILGSLKHHNVVRLFEVLQSNGHYCLAMEYYAGGSVCDHIQANGKLSESKVKNYIAQMMNGLQYIHDQGIVHRDLKLENLLLNFDRTVLAISDFGLSNFWRPGVELNTYCGSPEYAAPELFAKDVYDTKVDVWSSGVIVFAMLTARLPFDAEGQGKERLRELVHQIRASLTYKHLKKISHTSKELRVLICRMLNVDVELRISVPEILEDSWIKDQACLKSKVEVDITGEEEHELAVQCQHNLNLSHITPQRIIQHIKSPQGQFGKTDGCFNILRRDLEINKIKKEQIKNNDMRNCDMKLFVKPCQGAMVPTIVAREIVPVAREMLPTAVAREIVPTVAREIQPTAVAREMLPTSVAREKTIGVDAYKQLTPGHNASNGDTDKYVAGGSNVVDVDNYKSGAASSNPRSNSKYRNKQESSVKKVTPRTQARNETKPPSVKKMKMVPSGKENARLFTMNSRQQDNPLPQGSNRPRYNDERYSGSNRQQDLAAWRRSNYGKEVLGSKNSRLKRLDWGKLTNNIQNQDNDNKY